MNANEHGEQQLPLSSEGQRRKDFKKVRRASTQRSATWCATAECSRAGKYKPQRKVYLRWEIPSERIEWTDKEGHPHEGPMTIGRFYTASLSEKATLRRDLENWRGKGFRQGRTRRASTFSKILGTACQIMVAHNTEGGKDLRQHHRDHGPQERRRQTSRRKHALIKYSPDEPQMFRPAA